MNTCPYSQKIESKYSWSDANPFTPARASAQAATQYVDSTQNVYNPSLDLQNPTLPIPLLLVLLMFVVFVVVMSVVYVYHWTKFSLGDAFVERATFIYFIGLFILTLPLISFLF